MTLVEQLRQCAAGKHDEFSPHWDDAARRLMNWAADTIEAANFAMLDYQKLTPPVRVPDALALAERFHEAYERLAPEFGYETRTETREFSPDTKNGKLMVAVCRELLAAAPQSGNGSSLYRAARSAVSAWNASKGRGGILIPLDAAMMSLEDALSAPQSGKKGDGWIDVKERLPEVGQEVLCAYQDYECVTVGDQDMDKWTLRMFNGEGNDGFIECYAIAYGSRSYVTHWMPLPSPPASKAEGE